MLTLVTCSEASKAMEAAQKAVLLDSTNEDASTMLGELKFDAGEFACQVFDMNAGPAIDIGGILVGEESDTHGWALVG